MSFLVGACSSSNNSDEPIINNNESSFISNGGPIAIDGIGQLSQDGRASTVFIDVGTDSNAPVGTGGLVDESGLPEELATAIDVTFDLLTANSIEKVVGVVFRMDDPEAHGLTIVGIEVQELDSSVITTEYACPQGGSWTVSVSHIDPDTRNIQAEACRIGPITLTGAGQRIESSSREAPDNTLIFSRVTMLDSRNSSSIEMNYSFTSFGKEHIIKNVRATGVSVKLSNGTYDVEDLFLSETNGEPVTINLEAENVSGALAGFARIRSREPLLIGSIGYPTSGAVSVVQLNSNNESYDIAAANGNPDTFTFTVTVDGSTTAYEIPWTEERSIGGLEPLTVDTGF